VTDDGVRGLALTGWSLVHGFATLAVTANLTEQFGTDTAMLADLLTGLSTTGGSGVPAEALPSWGVGRS
jgi:hypothetical protein